MEIAVSHDAFLKQRLAVQTSGWFRGPRLLLNGTPLAKERGVYVARSDDGREIPIGLRIAFGNPLPVLTIGSETIRLGRPPSTMVMLRDAFFATLAILVVVISEHRGFPVSFVLAFACAVATVLAAERYPATSKLFRKRNVMAVLWFALVVSFGWEADAWARAGKPSKNLFSVGEAGPLFNWSLDTDPQLQVAASPHVLRAGQFQRCTA